MVMTSTEVLNLATAPVAGRSGYIAAARRFQVRNQRAAATPYGSGGGNVPGNREQELFLDDLEKLSPRSIPTPQHVHPETRATRNPNLTGLSPSDLIWLQRLPQDPSQISHDDAVQIATLTRSISSLTNASDGRLLQSIWQPIKTHHDRLAATAELEAARQPLPTVPASVVGALASALKAELPQHDDREVMARAEQMLTEVLSRRETEQFARIAGAEAAVAATEAAEQRRSETVRTV